MMMRNEQIEEKKDTAAENDNDGKELDKNRNKKSQTVLSRSDSTGSGRKFLAPTLSDPQARSSKDRFNESKKKSLKNKSQHLPHLTETSYHHTLLHHHHPSGHYGAHHNLEQQQNLTNHHVNLAFEVHDWWSEQMIFQESSDEEA